VSFIQLPQEPAVASPAQTMDSSLLPAAATGGVSLDNTGSASGDKPQGNSQVQVQVQHGSTEEASVPAHAVDISAADSLDDNSPVGMMVTPVKEEDGARVDAAAVESTIDLSQLLMNFSAAATAEATAAATLAAAHASSSAQASAKAHAAKPISAAEPSVQDTPSKLFNEACGMEMDVDMDDAFTGPELEQTVDLVAMMAAAGALHQAPGQPAVAPTPAPAAYVQPTPAHVLPLAPTPPPAAPVQSTPAPVTPLEPTPAPEEPAVQLAPIPLQLSPASITPVQQETEPAEAATSNLPASPGTSSPMTCAPLSLFPLVTSSLTSPEGGLHSPQMQPEPSESPAAALHLCSPIFSSRGGADVGELPSPVAAFSPMVGITGPVGTIEALDNSTLMDLNDDGAEGGPFAFTGNLGMDIPALQATPSPVGKKKVSRTPQIQVTRESIPLFVRESMAMPDSLEQQSLDDILPFSKKKQQQQQHRLGAVMEDEGAGSPAQLPLAAEVASPMPLPAAAPAPAATPLQQATPVAPAAAAAASSVKGLALQQGTPAAAGAAVRNTDSPMSGVTTSAKNTPRGYQPPAPAPLSGRSRIGGTYTSAGGASHTSGANSALKRSPAKSSPGAAYTDPGSVPLSQQAALKHMGSTMRKPSPMKHTPPPAQQAPNSGRLARVAPPAPRATGSPPPAVSAGAESPLLFDRTSVSPSMVYAANMTTPLAMPAGRAMASTPAEAALQPQAPADADKPASSTMYPTAPASWATPMAQLSALPLDLAVNMPLGDTSPFVDDWSGETLNIAEEAKKLMSALVAATPAPVYNGAEPSKTTPGPAAYHVSSMLSQTPPSMSPAAAQMLEMQIQVMVQKLAEAEEKAARLEKDNEALRDQIQIVQFEKAMHMEDDTEMERNARLYAEEQLAAAKQEAAALEGHLREQRAAADSARAMRQKLQTQLLQEQTAHQEAVEKLTQQLAQVTSECESAVKTLDDLGAKLMTEQSKCSSLTEQLMTQQQLNMELQQPRLWPGFWSAQWLLCHFHR